MRGACWRARLAVLGLVVSLGAPTSGMAAADDDLPTAWAEAEMTFPASSSPGKVIELDMGPGAENSFAVDRDSISVGKDGVIRFTMLVRSPSGARTVSHEGIRCATMERRFYAYGREDGRWSRARNERWSRIEPRAINAYALSLYREFFCPGGSIVRDVAEAVMALERGGHPSLIQR